MLSCAAIGMDAILSVGVKGLGSTNITWLESCTMPTVHLRQFMWTVYSMVKNT